MKSTKLEWEDLEESDQLKIRRSRAPNGWLVMMTNNESHIATCFVPDKGHDWLKAPNVTLLPMSELEALQLPIDELPISTRTKNCLAREDFVFVGEIVCHKKMIEKNSFTYLSLLTNLGTRSYLELIKALEELGFSSPRPNDEFTSWLHGTNTRRK